MDTPTPPKRVLKTPAAASYVSSSESTLEKLRIFGGGPTFVKLGARSVGYLVSDLDDWLQSRRRQSTSEPGE